MNHVRPQDPSPRHSSKLFMSCGKYTMTHAQCALSSSPVSNWINAKIRVVLRDARTRHETGNQNVNVNVHRPITRIPHSNGDTENTDNRRSARSISLNLAFKLISPTSSFGESLAKCWEPKQHDLKFYKTLIGRSRCSESISTAGTDEEITLAE